MDKILRLREPRDLLALVPYRLGFHPERSTVLVSVVVTAAGRDEVGLVARVDTADLLHPVGGPGVARGLARHLEEDGADAVLAVFYTDLDAGERSLSPELAQAREVLQKALGRVLDPWAVGPDSWGHLACAGCCPAQGRSLQDLTGSEVAAVMVLAGRSAARRRDDLAVGRAAAGPRAVAARAAEHAGVARRQERPGARRLDASGRWDRALGAAEARVPGPAVLGGLLDSLADRVVRDAVLARTLDGGSRPVRHYLDARQVARAFDAAGPPVPGAVEPAMALAGAVAAHAPDGGAAPALGMLAFLAWWSADGARADVLARQALDEEPGYALAELVVTALLQGMPPPWYRRRA
ncbi:DUF4192 domain-containing protein [Georgenia sp. AZ-5]|uniref:DUF4192 domain-containing protein n=1 Tax=Georgenia sp. AZ-5 TaxID=3367526 RepID=UPI003754757C